MDEQDTKQRTVRAQYYHSADRAPEKQQQIVRDLGFTHVNQILELPAGRPTLIMIELVPHLIRIIE